MESVFETLKERGLIQQCSDEARVASLLSEKQITYYAGFDATATSLHVGSLIPVGAMAHLQRAGHRPLAIIGGGTTMIGDPTDKTKMRPMLSEEQISANSKGMLSQLQRYLDLANGTASAEHPESDPKAGRFLNNADWLLSINYIEFLRDIGKHSKSMK